MWLLVLGVSALAGLAWLLPLRSLTAGVAQFGPVAPVLGIVVGAGLLVALLPRTPISLACGWLFGAVLGTVCALLVALLAAVITFGAGRLLGREFVRRHAGRRFERLERWVIRDGVLAVA